MSGADPRALDILQLRESPSLSKLALHGLEMLHEHEKEWLSRLLAHSQSATTMCRRYANVVP